MPLYEYECARCGRFEIIVKFSDPPLSVCPTCGAEVQKQFSSPAIQFKGTGWYITDYARKAEGGKSKREGEKGTGAASSEQAASKSESSKTDSSKAEASSGTPSKTTSKDGTASGQ